MRMVLRLTIAFVLSFVCLATPAMAQIQTITATHTYVMGDNDSRNDARHLCFLEAKRKVLEKTGSFIQSHSVVDNFNLTKDQITSYSAAVLSVETVKEEVGFTNGQNTLTLTVKADVDADQVKKLVGAIVADRSLADRVAHQQQQIRQLDEHLQTLNFRLSDAPINSASELRKERTVVFDNMAELDHIRLSAKQRIANEQDRIRQTSEFILKYGIRGMTPGEVRKLVGEPFSKLGDTDWYYGELCVCFNAPLSPRDFRVNAVVNVATTGTVPTLACSYVKENPTMNILAPF
jgi:hypothetical protein